MSTVDGRSAAIEEEVVLRVARDYYLEDRSKVEIAKRTGLSRWQVARVLREARESGLVRITIGRPRDADGSELERRLAAALGLDAAVVVDVDPAADGAADSIAAALAELLSESIREGQSVGLTWSRVIERLPARLRGMAPCNVVQLAGALSFPGDRLGSVEVTREVARIAGGVAHPFYAPLFVADAGTAAALRAQPEIARCLERVERLDVAVVSVGQWSERGSAVHPLVPAPLAAEVAAAGAVGDVSGRVFDERGAAVSTGFDDRIVGITAEQLRRVPRRIATSVGEYRARATIAAARAGLMSELVVDRPQAAAIVRLLDSGVTRPAD
ncbi:sugar-binding domain-containing protein [Saccharopolyspora sp. MS10]|uniref:sugar-binding domain-containing protein n=1 Tax=Saccharopolyspora sp. MS10 TaxID=3385973 RepID=UPI0039A02625